jgi:EAL domain-containing protein (putative c-di-GMP-specific phosphodiesterase class I)
MKLYEMHGAEQLERERLTAQQTLLEQQQADSAAMAEASAELLRQQQKAESLRALDDFGRGAT